MILKISIKTALDLALNLEMRTVDQPYMHILENYG